MRIFLALFCSTIALAAFNTAADANQSRAELKRLLAATGPASARLHAASSFHAVHQPNKHGVLYDFGGPPNDGTAPGAQVTLDSSGNIYGTTGAGGANNDGTIFKLTKKGESLLHSFGGAGDGITPAGALTIDENGNMFGTTQAGGAGGNGVIYELTTDGTYTVLHSFASNEGTSPQGRVTEDNSHNLFGTALYGGEFGYGTVFEYSPSGKLTVLHSFNDSEGEYPEHGVVVDYLGNLYGVTAFGGTNDDGTIYKIDTNMMFTTLYSFSGSKDGSLPFGGVAFSQRAAQGVIYGSTSQGGANNAGTVFRFDIGEDFATLYNFTGGKDGGNPMGDTLQVGKFVYGTVSTGGNQSCACGGVYRVRYKLNKGNNRLLLTFNPADGGGYSAGLTRGGKNYYGTNSSGGSANAGVVFTVKSRWK